MVFGNIFLLLLTWTFQTFCSGLAGRFVRSPPTLPSPQHLPGHPTLASAISVPRRYGGTLQNVSVKLPITLNKFFQPTEMASQDFFQRWKQLSR